MYKEITPKTMKDIQVQSGLSVRKFCKKIAITNGDFYRIMKGQKRINERILINTIMFAESIRPKTFWERLSAKIRRWIFR